MRLNSVNNRPRWREIRSWDGSVECSLFTFDSLSNQRFTDLYQYVKQVVFVRSNRSKSVNIISLYRTLYSIWYRFQQHFWWNLYNEFKISWTLSGWYIYISIFIQFYYTSLPHLFLVDSSRVIYACFILNILGFDARYDVRT